jgi:hypothetical protein
MFRENCLPDKIAVRIKKAEDMLTAWWILDAIYDNPLAFIKDLMQEIRAVPEFREEDCEKMMEYYMLHSPADPLLGRILCRVLYPSFLPAI